MSTPTLYERLGGVSSIAAVVEANPKVDEANPKVDEAHHRVSRAGFEYLVTEMVCWATGGPQKYTGRSTYASHAHLNRSEGEWQVFLGDQTATFDKFGVPAAERAELFAIVESTKKDIVLAR